MLKYNLLIGIFLLLLTSFSYSQVVVNEYSCSNTSDFVDNYNEYEDWIELYNTSGTAFDITGYYLSDKSGNPTKWQIPSVTIPANGTVIFYASGLDVTVGTNYHTNFKLTQTKPEKIVLSDNTGTLIEQIVLDPSQNNHSRGRITDGSVAWGVFTNSTPGASNTGSLTAYATKPIFDQAPGLYSGSTTVNISSPDANVSIYYTTDGTVPTASSTLVSGAITLSNTQVIRAISISSDPSIISSFIESNTYFIDDIHTMAVVSVSGNEVDNLLNGSNIEPIGAFEYFGDNQVLIDESTGDFNKHGNDSWAYDQRGFDYISRDQYGTKYVIQDEIFNGKDRTKFQRLILKPAANDNYPFEDGAHIRDAYVHSLSQIGHLKLDERSHESCILYLNGEYWGVYEIREKVDDSDFTDYYYDQDVPDIQFLKTWGGTWSEYGGPQAQTDWNDLKDYILSNDMTVEANFEYVSSQYNWKSLIDYVVLNSYVVCSDWLNWNTAWWRGLNPDGDKKKWRYALWDMDATFGHYINYTGIPDQGSTADPCDPEDLGDTGGQGHIPILNALMDNETFEQYYISRYIDLSNSVFSCDFMINHLDSLITIIEPEMTRQIDKWGGTYAEWEANVQVLRDFINDRCADLSEGMIECYDVTGPYDLNYSVDPPLSGRIKVNSLWVENFPFTGTYYGNIDILLRADAEPGWVFDYWELENHTVSPTINDDEATLMITDTDQIIAHFVPILEVDLGNDTLICEGASILLDAGVPDVTYLWQDGSTEQTFLATEAGTYSVTVTNEGFSIVDEIIIYISTIDAGIDRTICKGNSVILNGSGGGIYSWTPAETMNNPNIANPTATPLDTIIYYLTVIDSSNCSYTDSVNINVNPPLNITAVASDNNVCPGTEVNIIIQLNDGGGSPYTLYSEDYDVINSPYAVYPSETTEYTFHATDACLSQNSTSITINTHPAPAINIYASTFEGCQPLSVDFMETIGGSGYSYLWNFGDNINDSSEISAPTHLFEAIGSFDISLKVTNEYGCESIENHENMIKVYPNPIASFYPDNDFVSFLNPIVYFDNTSELIYNCYWDFDDNNSSRSISPIHRFEQIGEYNVELIVESINGCRDIANSKIIVDDEVIVYAPTAIVINSSSINNMFYVVGNGITENDFSMIIYDRWGGIVFETTEYDNSNPENHGWSGVTMDTEVGDHLYFWFVNFIDRQGKKHEFVGRVTVFR